MEETFNQTTEDSYNRYLPIITAICCIICITLFVGINLETNRENWDMFRKWGAPPETDIFNGDYWGLITSNFLHTEIWHIAFNLYWVWIFGKKIEFELGKLNFAVFVLSAALVSSLAQLAFSDSAGIGLSGIGYALFGFLLIKSRTSEKYKNYLSKRTINLFLLWLVLCIFLTRTGILNVGNAAHIGGMLWGLLLAYIPKYDKYMQWSASFSYLALLIILVLHSPFSVAYLSYRAYELHKSQKTDEAVEVYQKILKANPDNEFAKENLKQIEIFELQKKAYDLHNERKYQEARQVYQRILSLDKNNHWAKDNLSTLPIE